MQILKGEELGTAKITALIYSPPGIGKTTALGELPGKTLIIDVDRGTSVLKGNKNVSVVRLDESLTALAEVLAMLEKKCEYDTVCIDTLSELERAMLAILGRTGKNGGAPELSHYNQVGFKLADLCRRLRVLPAHIVFTAWLDLEKITSTGGETVTRACPMLSGKSGVNIAGLCDIVGELIMSPKDGRRYVRLEAKPDLVARDRIYKRQFCEPKNLLNGGN